MNRREDWTYEEKALIPPVVDTSRLFWFTAVGLSAIVLWALYAWYYQLQRGLGVTGMGRPIYWGFYITNFVFFIGVSHAGTLISAILRLTRAEWRRPITRAAEIITVAVIAIGASNVIIDLGREDRLLNVIFKPHLTSPLLWDVFSITTYLTGSVLYLYLPTIPDSAILRDRLPHRRWLYGPLSLGWTGTERQKKLLNRAIAIMAVIMVPIAVSVHTVVSWVFAMTIQPMWHSSIFGPYFVVGAIYSGIAAIIVAMAIIRKGCHLEAFLKPLHFDYLGRLLLVMTLLWTYFTFAEYITTYYGNSPDEIKVMMSKLTGPFAPYFWTMVICCLPIPLIILGVRRFRTITGTVIASLLINVGMWLERFTIVIPTLSNPRIPRYNVHYTPSWVEVSLMAGCFALFILVYMGFAKLFPIISIWEIEEGKEGVQETAERLESYLPEGERDEATGPPVPAAASVA